MSKGIRAAAGLLVRFCHGTSGGVAIIFALTLIPLVGFIGLTIDYTTAARIQTRLAAAADAAAIASIANASPAFNAAMAMSSDGPISAGATDAINVFHGNISGMTGFTMSNVSATVSRANGAVTSVVTFNASVPTIFMPIFGIPTVALSGSSSASNGLPTYIDFYLLLDNTPSMGVGATPADVSTMVNNTPDQCAFACHDTTNPNSYYNLAQSLGVTMRIDVVRQATQQLMTTATAVQGSYNLYRMAIYTFGTSASNAGLDNIAPLTSSLTTAQSQASNIQLMTVAGQNQNNDMDTGYDPVLTAMNTAIPNPGPGSSTSPQKVLFFVSDGVADEVNPGSCSQPLSGTRCQEPINVALCTAIKNRGIRIAVLYTTYLPLPTNAWYNSWIAPFVNNIGTDMQSCASPGLYFQVSPTQGISEAMNQLFQNAVATARLTQ